MISIGQVNAMCDVKAQGMDVCFDPQTQQQVLSFKFALHVSLPQLLQQLLEFQRRDNGLSRSNFGGGCGNGCGGGGAGGGGGGSCGGGGSNRGGCDGGCGSFGCGGCGSGVQHCGGGNCNNGCCGGCGGAGGNACGTGCGNGCGTGCGTGCGGCGCGNGVCNGGCGCGTGCGNGASMAGSIQSPGLTHVSIPLGGAQPQLPPPPALPALPQQVSQPKVPGLLNEAALAALGGVSHGSLGQSQNYMNQQGCHQPAVRSQPYQQPQESPPVQAPMNNAGLFKALRAGDIAEMRAVITQRADVNEPEAGPRRLSPLHCALECGGNVDAVHHLLKSKAAVNAALLNGETPLHLAMSQFMTIPPLVVRMLLCNQADLAYKSASGLTPLDRVREISNAAQNSPGDACLRVRQILNEVTEMPTLDIYSVEGSAVKSAHFADMKNDKVVFNTDSSIGTYSLANKRLTFMKKLKQQRGASSVEFISANPALGTLAVCLVIVESMPNGGQKLQNVFIIWPNGRLQEEEPLKLSVTLDPQPDPKALPACVILSRTEGPQLLLSRLYNGKVFSWRLNAPRTQLVVESQLTKNAGIVAASDDGCWIAIVTHQEEKNYINVFSYESPSGPRHEPVSIWSAAASPVCMAIQQSPRPSAGGAGRLAMVEAATEGSPPPPIEVWDIGVDGTGRMMYRLNVPSPCRSLCFCYGIEKQILSGHTDGLSVLYDLPKGTTSQCHGSPESGCLSISTDHKLVVSTESECFRIFRLKTAPDMDQ